MYVLMWAHVARCVFSGQVATNVLNSDHDLRARTSTSLISDWNVIMRARHVQHSVPQFPVYSAAFLSKNDLVLGGGGGASKTGIKNKLVRDYDHRL